MSAQTFNLTTTPVQISDGTKAVYIQEIRGNNTRFTCTTTQPDPATVSWCQILKNDIGVAAGFPIWAWSADEKPIQLTVLKAEF